VTADIDDPTYRATDRFRHIPAAQLEVDEMAVERAIAGNPPATLTCAEREEAVRRLHALHLTDPQIAERTRLCGQTVLRIRKRLGLPSHHNPYNRWAA